jgi:uncharacterized membrane protein (UPF0127 family)
MPKWTKLVLLIGLVGFVLLIYSGAQYASQYKTAVLKLNDCSIQVEIADTPALRQRGLSGRKHLAENAGMLFIFERPDYHSFWMKDMNFPLDLIWILNGKIVDITSRVPPPSGPVCKFTHYRPSSPANRVLEVKAGVAEKCGVKVGDEITGI